MAATASSRLVGRGSIYTLATAGPMLTGILITPLLTRTISVDDYGVVALAIVVMQFLVGVLSLGLPLVITRHVFVESTGDAGARGLALVGASLVLLATAIAATIGLTLTLTTDLDLQLAFLLAVVAGGAGAGVSMAGAWAVAHDRARFYVLISLCVSLLAPVVGVSAVLLGPRNAVTYFSASTLVYVLVDVAALVFLLRRGPVVVRRSTFLSGVLMGLPLVPHLVATSSVGGATVFVTGAVLGVGASAHAQIGVYLGTVPLIVVSALSYAWTPLILSAEPHEVGPRLSETARTVGWLAAYGGVSVSLLSPWLLRLITAPTYDRAAIVPIAAVTSLVAAVSVVFLAHLQLVVASGRTGPLAYLSPLALLCGAGAAALAAAGPGLAAVGVGYLASYLFLAAGTRWLARRVSRVRWDESVLLLPIGFAALGTCAAILLPLHGATSSIRALAGVVVVVLGARTLWRTLTSRQDD